MNQIDQKAVIVEFEGNKSSEEFEFKSIKQISFQTQIILIFMSKFNTTMTLQEVFDSFENDFHRTPQKKNKVKEASIYQTGSAASSAGTRVSKSDIISPQNRNADSVSSYSTERNVKIFSSSRRETTPIKDHESQNENLHSEFHDDLMRADQQIKKTLLIQHGEQEDNMISTCLEEKSQRFEKEIEEKQIYRVSTYNYEVEEEDDEGQSRQSSSHEEIDEEHKFQNEEFYNEDFSGSDNEMNIEDIDVDKENKDPLEKSKIYENLQSPLGNRINNMISFCKPTPFENQMIEHNNNSNDYFYDNKISQYQQQQQYLSRSENDSNFALNNSISQGIFLSASRNQRTPLRDITSGSPIDSNWDHSAKQTKNQSTQLSSSGKGKNSSSIIFFR